MNLNFYLMEIFEPMVDDFYANKDYGIEKIAAVSDDFFTDIESISVVDSTLKRMMNSNEGLKLQTMFNPDFFPSLKKDKDDVVKTEEEYDELAWTAVEMRFMLIDDLSGELVAKAQICAHPSSIPSPDNLEFSVLH